MSLDMSLPQAANNSEDGNNLSPSSNTDSSVGTSREAVTKLLSVSIPLFASELISDMSESQHYLNEPITEIFHRRGLNMR